MLDLNFAIVGRMEGLWPHQLAKVEMHRARRGGDLGHIDLSRQNRILIGGENWVDETLARIEEVRYGNYNRELDALKKRKRKKDLMARMVEGPRDPWRDSRHGPIRELILTANKDFFADNFRDLFEGPSPEERFEELAVAWLKETFGDDLVHARADCDEAAYHIHAVILPLETTRDGRTMLQPSRHAVIADYEHFQDEIGTAFAPLGLVRGERRAQAIREARERGETPPPQRRHVRTRTWREEEERRLARERARLMADEAEQRRRAVEAQAAMRAERAAIEAAKADQQRKAAEAEARMTAERARLAAQAHEQDAVLAAAEALGAGLIDPTRDEITLTPANPGDPVATGIMARITKSRVGWRRFASALAPGWQRMRKAAKRTVEAELERDRALLTRGRDEIEHVWEQLATMTRHLLPQGTAVKNAREQVTRALGLWSALKARDARSRDPGQRDD